MYGMLGGYYANKFCVKDTSENKMRGNDNKVEHAADVRFGLLFECENTLPTHIQDEMEVLFRKEIRLYQVFFSIAGIFLILSGLILLVMSSFNEDTLLGVILIVGGLSMIVGIISEGIKSREDQNE